MGSTRSMDKTDKSKTDRQKRVRRVGKTGKKYRRNDKRLRWRKRWINRNREIERRKMNKRKKNKINAERKRGKK